MAQAAPPSTPYGAPISIDAAKKAMAAAEACATQNNWGVAIAIVDSGANLVMLHRLDNAQLSSVRIAEQKARTAAEFRRPTKVFEDAVAGGGIGLRVLTLARASPKAACRSSRRQGHRRHRRVGRAVAPGCPGRKGEFGGRLLNSGRQPVRATVAEGQILEVIQALSPRTPAAALTANCRPSLR